jgi:hypothetical protein
MDPQCLIAFSSFATHYTDRRKYSWEIPPKNDTLIWLESNQRELVKFMEE